MPPKHARHGARWPIHAAARMALEVTAMNNAGPHKGQPAPKVRFSTLAETT
jgi:hypothetical protein